MSAHSSNKKSPAIEPGPFEQKPFGRNNFIFMAVAGVMIVSGFLLMLGGTSTEESFNPDIFSTRRIVVGPAITFLGFVAMAVAVWLKPRAKKNRS